MTPASSWRSSHPIPRWLAIPILLLGLTACPESKRGDLATSGDSTGARPTGPVSSEKEPGTDRGKQSGSPDSDDDAFSTSPLIQLGTDEFLNSDALVVSPPPGSAEGDVILNFVGADVREVVQTVLGEILGFNYVVDPAVTGTVTIQTIRAITHDDLLPVLEGALRANNLVLAREGELYRVMPRAGALRAASPVSIEGGPRTPGYGVEVVPLQYVSAQDMAKVLEPFAPEGSILHVDPSRNLIMISGTGDERSALVDAIALFDVDWISGMSFGLFPLENVDPDTLVDELDAVFGQGLETPIEGLYRFVPVSRINAVLVITSRSLFLEQARYWIEELDRSAESSGQKLFVYSVENFRAAELADVLNELLGNRRSSRPPPSLAPGVEPTTLGEVEVEGQRDEASQAELPAQATRSAAGVRRPISGNGSPLLKPQDDVRVIALDASNSLVILAAPQDYRMIEDALQQIDVTPLQVLIEATIAEVTLNDNLRYGVQWFLDSGQKGEFTLSEVASGAASQIFPGFSYLFRFTQDVRVVLNALSEVTDVEVISSPQLMVLDNQDAELQVGDEVPVATQSAVSVTNPEAPIVNTIEFRDTGVILKVTPRVSRGGVVLMDIEQEVSSVVETVTSGIDSPTIRQRRITSTVAIQGGETVTLGGLIRDSYTQSSSGVPLLSEIPILGALFGAKRDDDERTELLVLLTPRVVRNADEAREVTEELRNRMRTVEPLGVKIE